MFSGCEKHILLHFMNSRPRRVFDFFTSILKIQALSGCHIKAKINEINGFLLVYHFFSASIDSFQILNSKIFRN